MEPNQQSSVALDKARKALLERYLRGDRRPNTREAARIPRRNESGPAPLSYSQHQIWLHSQLAGAHLIYNEPITIHRNGELNIAALEKSFTEIVRRHEAWRTTFHWQNGQMTQTIHSSPATIRIPFLDLRSHTQPEQEALRLATQDARQPFDLARGPMYRLQLIRLRDAEYRLYLTLHHIIFDGMSLYRVLLPELLTSYHAFTRNDSPVFNPLPIQYADYASWQRDLFKEISQNELSYWRKVCEDLPVLDLPTDRPRPSIQTYPGAVEPFQISRPTTDALKALSQEQGVTLFMTMTAAFVTLLHGYTGQEDIAVGGISSGRNHEDTMGLLGCFLNTVVIRSVFSKNLPFTNLLSQTRSATLGALSRDDVPFELLVQELTRDRDPSRAPLVQALIVVEPPLEPLPNGWGFTHMDIDNGTAKFDLQLDLDHRAAGFFGRFIYNTDLFQGKTIERLKSRWLDLLNQIVAAPDQRVCDLTAAIWRSAEVTAAEPSPQWNETRTNYPRSSSIHQLFEEQAERTPSAIALVSEKTQVSYDALNRQANQLARQIEELKLAKGVPIGVWMERSPAMVVALLAVLKSGAAYVPLDPSYPEERLAMMIDDTQTPLILTQQHLQQRGSSGRQEVRLLRVALDESSDKSDENLTNTVEAEDLAYIMYTSGSTGPPKGVAVPHRAVVRLVKETDYAAFSPNDTFLQLAPISFDASTFEIWGPLLNGGKLVVMPPAPPTLEEIGNAIREHRITTLWLTAGLFNAIVDEKLEDLRSLKQLIAGGDVLSVPHVAKALGELRKTRLINGYGPTESTTFACCYNIPPDPPVEDPIPIGKPIANTTIHILDPGFNPVAVGVVGELYIGGDGLAKGYWNQPDLTKQKFISDPFSNQPGAKLYKTGDLGRWRHDGIIEFLGRTDHQMKLRGYRIEPGEIESALKRQPDVLDSVVITREDMPGDKRLVAYIVRKPGVSPNFDQSTIIAALRKSLPAYLLPSAIVALPALPRTPNGKFDRDALPAPDWSLAESSREQSFPRTTLEEKLVTIWSAILGLKQVGVTDNFFNLGGHSLLGLRLVNRLREVLGISVPLSIVFERPTIEGMAELLEKKYNVGNQSGSTQPRPLPAILPVDRNSRRARRS